MATSKDDQYYLTLLSESEIRLTDEIPEPEYGPVEVGEVYGDDAAMHVTIKGIDGYSNSEIRTIIEAAFERSLALKLLSEEE